MPRNQGTSRKGKPGKHDREAGMGKALQRAQGQRYRPKPNGRRMQGGGMGMQVGVADIGGEGDGDNINSNTKAKSVLELRDLDDFLWQADLAQKEFKSEREGVVVLDATGQVYRPSTVQWADESDQRPEFTFTELSVPRRPAWNESTTPEELQVKEQEAFFQWRRAIAHKEEELLRQQQQHQQFTSPLSTTTVTPFEKNLQVWRQLWRVLERSSCLLQLVDARNPLFYLSHDLREYAQSLGKPMMVLVNKSDYLSPKQRGIWKKYLVSSSEGGWDSVLFFSAALEQQKLDELARQKQRQERSDINSRIDDMLPDEEDEYEEESDHDDSVIQESSSTRNKPKRADPTTVASPDGLSDAEGDIPPLLNRQELMEAMMKFARQHDCQPDARYDNRIQFGMVGFPNVGKSSVINVLMGSSKHTHGLVRVGVAAQPGKTKHFQTLLLPDQDELMLCDCPGLVFPSFVSNTADLIAAGVYPISQMRDHWPVVNLICQRIPREILNAQYAILIPVPAEYQHSNLAALPPPTGEEFLSTLCEARGMMAAASGVPDYTRAARMVIQDYATGKLLYCHAPPTSTTSDSASDPNNTAVTLFHQETLKTAMERTQKLRIKLEKQQEQEQQQNRDHQYAPTKSSINSSAANNNDCSSDDEDDADETAVDNGLMEFLAGGGGLSSETFNKLSGKAKSSSISSSSPFGQPSRRSKRKGGRKNQNRQEDPYGCHASPSDDVMAIMDSMLLDDDKINKHNNNKTNGPTPTSRHHKGVTVNAGKYGRKDYTRPTGPGFTTAMTETITVSTPAS
ncbi:hypothetical protein ACA910_009787 [Epithemia clementina (nom. ined.)]